MESWGAWLVTYTLFPFGLNATPQGFPIPGTYIGFLAVSYIVIDCWVPAGVATPSSLGEATHTFVVNLSKDVQTSIPLGWFNGFFVFQSRDLIFPSQGL